MEAAEHIGCLATVRAADGFYQFIDGWQGRVIGHRNGLCLLEVEAMESGLLVKKQFDIPAAQLEFQ